MSDFSMTFSRSAQAKIIELGISPDQVEKTIRDNMSETLPPDLDPMSIMFHVVVPTEKKVSIQELQDLGKRVGVSTGESIPDFGWYCTPRDGVMMVTSCRFEQIDLDISSLPEELREMIQSQAKENQKIMMPVPDMDERLN